jgi:hypothetical protein
MSATLETTGGIDTATLDSVIANATAQQRRYLVAKLLPIVIEDDHYRPLLVHNAEGKLLGVLVPEFRSTATEPPKLTPEERDELQRRLDTLDQVVSYDQMLKNLGLADIPLPRRL